MRTLNINFTAVIVASVVSMIVGRLWFSPLLFGRVWRDLIKKTDREMKQSKPAQVILLAFLGKIITCYILAIFFYLLDVRREITGVEIATLIWLGFVVTTSLAPVIFEGKQMKLYLLNVSYELASLVIMGYLLVVW